MTVPHPIHLHGGQFQVVERSTAPGFESAADSVRLGLLDEGLRDTVLVMPGERVKIRMCFDRHPAVSVSLPQSRTRGRRHDEELPRRNIAG